MILQGDCLEVLKTLPDESVNCCVTSPPYWGLRDYGVSGQLGLEKTPEEYVARMVEVFREVRRVLRSDGTLWLNLGDSYVGGGRGGDVNGKSGLGGGKLNQEQGKGLKSRVTGLRSKNLVGIPWRVAFALQTDGWYLRQDIIWHNPNPMPESVTDRCTKAHEYIFLLSKSPTYFFDSDAIKEPAIFAGKRKDQKKGEFKAKGEPSREWLPFRAIRETRNRRSVWTVSTKPFRGAHFATFPPDLIAPCVLAGSPEGGTVLDVFFGAGTTGLVAKQNNRKYVGIELNPEYIKIASKRLLKEETL